MSTKDLMITTSVILSFAAAVPAHAGDAPKVVTSIPPLNYIAAAVMDGVGTPETLLPPGASPHAYSLKPSEASRLAEADLVVWVGDALEAFLEKPLHALSSEEKIMAVIDLPSVSLLESREAGLHEDHQDEAHGHDAEHGDHAEHAEDAHGHDVEHGDHAEHAEEEHGHEAGHDEVAEHAEEEHGHEAEHADHGHGHGHDHGEHDPHVWLAPANAAAIAGSLAERLASIAPDQASIYRANAERFAEEMDQLEQELRGQLAPVADHPYLTFHDAMQYFDEAMDLNFAGAITFSPEQSPGAARVAELQEAIEHDDIVCIFAEPQFEPRLASVVIEGTDARLGTVDPLGVDIEAGADAYADLLRKIAQDMLECLDASS
ncbi:MAG: zinc ABC transporter substrate-binding protein [Geminicoccaceae bacterium]